MVAISDLSSCGSSGSRNGFGESRGSRSTSRVQFEIGRATHSTADPWLSWRLLRATCSDWSTGSRSLLLHRLCIRRIGIVGQVDTLFF